MKFYRIILGLLGIALLVGCSPNPIIRVQAIRMNAIVPTEFNIALGIGIAESKLVHGSQWKYEKKNSMFFVTSKIELNEYCYADLNDEIKDVKITIGFLISQPKWGTETNLMSKCYIEYSRNENKEQVLSKSSSQKWLKAIVESDLDSLKNLIKLSLL